MKKFINLIIILSVIITSGIKAQELPSLGNYSATVLSTAQERQLGQAFMQEITAKVPLVQDPLINNYLQTLGYKLVSHTDHGQTKFHFFIVKNNTINAFAGPGGYVGVNAGIILITKTESELAGVLAHEITHVTQHHIARAITRQKQLALPTMAAILAAVVLGTQAGTDVAAGVIGATVGGSIQGMINFTRHSEQEADRIGIQTLYRSGFNPMAMPNFFERMQQAEFSAGNDIPEYLRTHPLTTSRIADAKNRTLQYQVSKTALQSSEDYYLMRARIRVELSRTGKDAANYFHDQLKNNTYQNRDAIYYGYALALLKAKHPDTATKIINQLLQQQPHQVVYQMALAEIKTTTHHPKTAVPILKNALEFNPDFYPLIVQYAKTLIIAKQFNTAGHFITQEIQAYPNDATLYTLLSQAQGNAGNLTAAYQARAKVFALNGNNNMAIIQLQQALKQPNLDRHTKIIINAKIASLKSWAGGVSPPE